MLDSGPELKYSELPVLISKMLLLFSIHHSNIVASWILHQVIRCGELWIPEWLTTFCIYVYSKYKEKEIKKEGMKLGLLLISKSNLLAFWEKYSLILYFREEHEAGRQDIRNKLRMTCARNKADMLACTILCKYGCGLLVWKVIEISDGELLSIYYLFVGILNIHWKSKTKKNKKKEERNVNSSVEPSACTTDCTYLLLLLRTVEIISFSVSSVVFIMGIMHAPLLPFQVIIEMKKV